MKTALITGGNSGIGKETARALVGLGWRVLIAARDAAKSKALVESIRAANPRAQIDWLSVDLSDFNGIEAFAAEVSHRMPVIDALVLNAGLYTRQLTTNRAGIELMFATTHLGHFLLTHHLLSNVRASSDGRIVVSSSVAQWMGGRMDLDTMCRPSSSQFLQWAPFKAYGRSKLANMLFVRELAKRLQGTSIKVNGFHPGGIKSDFWRDTPGWVTAMVDPFLVSEAKGAKTQIYLASHQGLHPTGEYWSACKVRRGSPANRDPALSRQLWQYSEQVFGITNFGQPTTAAPQMKAG
ncbi:SDR family NAD(P)-dependent oxidoreductase [Aquabacterium sp.]|uniref:SDR family NAD(P)-dependent oxidoreductase n=1 Tax=Aquabacterium sp. TaxID=1872578 RepID=UPI00199CEBE9|nr:SDR family NAD(P)-dependent oxidoreductase [Aquabacterium sp.]MBC7701264.1 SDR family NAD(P)-dependent oxidoreductase [Aquabacterium sp.]